MVGTLLHSLSTGSESGFMTRGVMSLPGMNNRGSASAQAWKVRMTSGPLIGALQTLPTGKRLG